MCQSWEIGKYRDKSWSATSPKFNPWSAKQNLCHFNFLLLSFVEKKGLVFIWILFYLNHQVLFALKNNEKNIYECRLLQSWLAL